MFGGELFEGAFLFNLLLLLEVKFEPNAPGVVV